MNIELTPIYYLALDMGKEMFIGCEIAILTIGKEKISIICE
jgi:hypothetical protein